MNAPRDRFTALKVIFPLFLLLGLNIHPYELAVYEQARQAHEAEKGGQPGLATIRLYGLLEHRPWQKTLWERAGLQQIAKGDDDRAIHDLQMAAQAGKLSLEGQFALAQAYERTGDYRQAAVLWEGIANLSPSVSVYEHLAFTLRETGQIDESIAAFRSWQALDPTNAFIAYRLGIDLAVSAPDEALVQLGEAARLDQRYAPALETLQTAFALADLNQDEGYRLTVVGRALASLGEWELAETTFTRAVAANPEYAEAWAFLGEARLQMGKGGLAELNRALDINPNSVLSRVLMALYWGRKGEWEQAIKQMLAVIRTEPQRSIWRIELGNLYAQQGDLVLAQAEYHKAVTMDPRNGEAWRALAQFCLTYNVALEDTGLPAAREAIALDAEDAAARSLAGAILIALGDVEAGKQELLEALQLNANLPEANFYLGSLYLQQLEMASAEEYLARAAELDPKGGTGELARRLLERYFAAGTGGSN